jgi:GNAT superfamily N-acetyltransferase
MLTAQITRSSPVIRTARVLQMEGMFDVPAARKNQQTWSVKLDLPEHWNIGLIVGPSGCGKSAIAEELFQRELVRGFKWDARKSLLDGFPAVMSIKDIVQLLSSVGFSSPPAWVRPFHVLSNGEQFRVTMARALAENKELAVVDEFTSVVDRTVAKIGSAAIAKTVRRRQQKFIAVTCHYDVAPWLAPDWIYQPHVNKFALARGSLQRPPIALEIRRVHSSAWELFQPHHYLSADLNRTAVCFCAFLDDQPVAFDAWLPFVGKLRGSEKGRRCHRIVTLPDFQGVSIGNALLAHDAGVWAALGYRALISTGHPGFMHALARDQHWQMTASPRRTARDGGSNTSAATRSADRLMASFRYTGPPADLALARQLVG